MLEGVTVVEIVTLSAKLDFGGAIAELFHQKRVVLLNYLPN